LQKDCGVYRLKMSDFGVREQELPAMADNARDTMGGLFGLDRYPLSREETIGILRASFR